MTKKELAEMLSKEEGISQGYALDLVGTNNKQWLDFAKRHGLKVDQRTGQQYIKIAKAGKGVDALLEQNWNSIKGVNDAITSNIDGGRYGSLKSLSSALKDLQGAYLQLSEIKQRTEDREGSIIKRQAVESILQECLPQLKQALNDLFGKIRLDMPADYRTEFEVLYNRYMPDYARYVQEAIERINKLLV